MWERLWEKVWNNLKCLKRCAFQCIKSLKMGFYEEQKKSEIRLKSELAHPWTKEGKENKSFFCIDTFIFCCWCWYYFKFCFSSIKTITLFISRHINIILHWGVFGWSELNFGHIQKCSVFMIGTNHSNFLNRLHLDTWRVLCQKAFHTWNNVNIWLETINRLEICLFMDIRQIIDLGC